MARLNSKIFCLSQLFFIVLLMACLSGCGPRRSVSEGYAGNNQSLGEDTIGQSVDLLEINSLLLYYPQFEKAARKSADSSVNVYRKFVQVAEQELGLRLHKLDIDELAGKGHAELDGMKNILALGTQFRVDAVMVPVIHSYKERSGSAFGTSAPASIAMTIRTFRVRDAKMVWEYVYQYTDRSISENIFSIGERYKRGGGSGWASVDSILVSGIEEACRDFSRRRTAQFTS